MSNPTQELPRELKQLILNQLDPETQAAVAAVVNRETKRLPCIKLQKRKEKEKNETQPLLFWTDQDIDQLNDLAKGYCVKDNFLKAAAHVDGGGRAAGGEPAGAAAADDVVAAARGVRNELQLLMSETDGDGRPLFRDATMIGSGQWKDAQTRSDQIMWLTDEKREAVLDPAVRPWLCRLMDRLDRLRDELQQRFQFQCARTTTQFAVYPEGGRYVRHLDAHSETETGAGAGSTRHHRCLTLLYYANDGWTADDGGCLRIYHPSADTGADLDQPYTDIEPVGDRLLVFQSRLLEHEVLPTQKPRFSITNWLYN